jgi:hypothetical protein
MHLLGGQYCQSFLTFISLLHLDGVTHLDDITYQHRPRNSLCERGVGICVGGSCSGLCSGYSGECERSICELWNMTRCPVVSGEGACKVLCQGKIDGGGAGSGGCISPEDLPRPLEQAFDEYGYVSMLWSFV